MKSMMTFTIAALLFLPAAYSQATKCTTAIFVAKDFASDWYIQLKDGADSLREENTFEYTSHQNGKKITKSGPILTWQDCFDAALKRAIKETPNIAGLVEVSGGQEGDSTITSALKKIGSAFSPVYKLAPLEYVYVYWQFERTIVSPSGLRNLLNKVGLMSETVVQKGAVTPDSRDCLLLNGEGLYKTGLLLYKRHLLPGKRNNLGVSGETESECTDFNNYSSL